MTFADKVENAANAAYITAAPFMPSKAEICDSIQLVINELWAMSHNDAVAFIKQSYSHTGHQALAVRMFKKDSV